MVSYDLLIVPFYLLSTCEQQYLPRNNLEQDNEHCGAFQHEFPLALFLNDLLHGRSSQVYVNEGGFFLFFSFFLYFLGGGAVHGGPWKF